ncbi:dihydrofolate reductase family protein [Salibacterium aidingense]|uniref:dihydrofolate reductase family protein n=1 Tax=Salibacterium aidingense TaxID=384933 RepID=UPI0004097B12|nr:dihydrofolate reductase family protein [Salibacterium aidingense]
MAKVVIDMSLSLDGFIAGVHDNEKQPLGENGSVLHEWLFQGTAPIRDNDFFKLSEPSHSVLEASFENTGAILTGRRTYDIVGGWGGSHPFQGVPVYVMTHQAPETVPEGTTSFHFVTDGIEQAVVQAKKEAEDKNIGVSGAVVAQQCLEAGLVDELHLHLVPVLLGGGIRLFKEQKAELEWMKAVEAPGVTHLFYRVRKNRSRA